MPQGDPPFGPIVNTTPPRPDPSARLEALRHLGDDWSGYGEERPTDAALATAAAISFVPLSSGGVQVELHTGDSDVELEIGPDGRVAAVSWSRP